MSFQASRLHNEISFYQAFLADLEHSQNEVIIESPYITASRMELFYPILDVLVRVGVKVYIITRDPVDHEDEYMRNQAVNEILRCTELGVKVILLSGYHHRKLALIDRKVLWEGSLNILSQTNSLEIMRRIEDKNLTKEMFSFLNLSKLLSRNCNFHF